MSGLNCNYYYRGKVLVKTIRVIVHGATGKMGQEVVAAVSKASDMSLVGAVCNNPRNGSLDLPGDLGSIALSTDLLQVINDTHADVVVDFTNSEACMQAAKKTLFSKTHFITGSTGLTENSLKLLHDSAMENHVGVIVASNFAMGAVLLMDLAKKAAAYFDYVDIIESHHEEKLDAPSGTSLSLAKAISENKLFKRSTSRTITLDDTTGGDFNGIGVHSLRQPGRLAHHEVIFGSSGQTLTLRHDTLDRGCCMPGVILAIRQVQNTDGLIVGLDKIMEL